MKLYARGRLAAAAGLAAVIGLAVASGPATGAPAAPAARDRSAVGATSRAGASARPSARAKAPTDSVAGARARSQPSLIKHDVGGSELASPGVVVHYPAAGAIPLPQVPASAYVIADAKTGQVLAAKDAHGLFPPASTLKVLTAVTLIPRLNPNATVLTSKDAAQTAEFDVGLVAGRRYKVSDLFRAILLISANDAAVALTEATGSLAKGMALINAEAHHLQAYDVVAKVPNGLPADGQVVSAYDEALIARQALAMPAFMKYDSTLTAPFRISPHTVVSLVNQNRLLTDYPGGIGGKIGWTVAAESTYVGMARRHGVTLIVTVLHCTTQQEITAGEQLLDWGFAMDGKVRPVGELVRPLPATLTGSHKKLTRPAARPAGSGSANFPAVPLATGAGALILVVLGAGWLGLRRRRSAAAASAPAAPASQDRPQADLPSAARHGQHRVNARADSSLKVRVRVKRGFWRVLTLGGPGVVLSWLMYQPRNAKPVPPGVRQPHQRLPPVPGRLARHRQPRETRRNRLIRRPRQQTAQLIGLRLDDPAGQHPALMIDQRRGLLILAQVDGQHCPVPPDHLPRRGDPLVPVPVPTCQPATLSHERPAVCVLGSEARQPHQEDVPSATWKDQQVVTKPATPRRPRRSRRPGRVSPACRRR
jgi:D-alanyl-D-alanine carboxypeptidase (penicillin-binding protein 5/6)